MTTNSFINLDARYLADLVASIREQWAEDGNPNSRGLVMVYSGELARLLAIASNLESMDAKIARHIDGTFAGGEAEAALRATSRSNLLRPARRFTNAEGEVVIAALAAGQVRRLPAGARTPPKAKVIEVPAGKPARPARKGYRLEDL